MASHNWGQPCTRTTEGWPRLHRYEDNASFPYSLGRLVAALVFDLHLCPVCQRVRRIYDHGIPHCESGKDLYCIAIVLADRDRKKRRMRISDYANTQALSAEEQGVRRYRDGPIRSWNFEMHESVGSRHQ